MMDVPLAPSELVALLGDRFAGSPSLTTGKYHLLSGAGTVALNPIAETVVQAAFLGLERDGLVQLERAPKSTFFGLRKSHTVLAELAGGGAAAVGAIEAGLLDALRSGRAEVDEVVYTWFGEDQPWPQIDVMSRVRDGLVARGAVERTETEEKGFLRTKTEVAFTVSAATQAALAAADVEALKALLADAGGRPDLRESLRAEVRQGLMRRVDRGGGSAGEWPD
ncbi:MAG TPA: hypothetical protein VGB53_15260 [Rubricoccaceae bacterium]|jgi:hypothetical protein